MPFVNFASIQEARDRESFALERETLATLPDERSRKTPTGMKKPRAEVAMGSL